MVNIIHKHQLTNHTAFCEMGKGLTTIYNLDVLMVLSHIYDNKAVIILKTILITLIVLIILHVSSAPAWENCAYNFVWLLLPVYEVISFSFVLFEAFPRGS